MQKKIYTPLIMLIAGCFLFPSEAHAATFEFQPRLETGLFYYSIDLAALSETTLSNTGAPSGRNAGHDKIEFSDNMGFIGGGATFFIGRLFADLSVQRAFKGSARCRDALFEYDKDNNTFLSAEAENQAQFDRTDGAVAIGYAVTRKFSLYAGYKWAKLDLDNAFDGRVSYLVIDDHVLNGRAAGVERNKFQYEGPFVGLTDGWDIGKAGFFHGLISAKLALAYLKSKLRQDLTQTLIKVCFLIL